ncbi:hypothetical protein C8R44DRAFT_849205 [Mycena epipterygia]|nr:hypothetical protein C8R44DRAFT_849205 [Mycena epipterygia]
MSTKRPATSPGLGARMDSGITGDHGGPSTPTLQKRHSASTLTPHETTAPPRPPRNPARAGIPEPKLKKKTKTKRPSTATGTREEVTPWEFFPVNTPTEELSILTSDETVKQSSATATGKREDVLPWELFPAPDYDAGATNSGINGSHPQANHTRQPRPSISSSSILSFQDMTLLRRRKSTGAKPPNPPVAFGSAFPNGSPRASTSTNNPSKSPSSSPKVLHKTPSSSTVRPPLPKASSGPVPTISSLDTTSPPTPQPQAPGKASPQDPNFSTADRTILKELKRNISARAAQFVIKGGPAESGRVTSTRFARLGTKHHAYSRDEVPYPRSYAREVLDLDVWETMACQRICNSLTWHVFTTPPTKVLDIGCGTGTWILNCGMAWRNCHFVGMDVVPLHPDLGTSELSTRITWVQANFLEGLPFHNDEFDFVHIKRIALGVPEDKWDPLFEEISRVLKSGGAFELIEEDLFFPGKTSDDDGDSDSDATSELRYARDSGTSDGIDHEDDESVITGSGGSRMSYDGSAPTPNTSLGAIPVTPPRTASPLPMMGALIREEDIEETSEEASLVANSKKSPLVTESPNRHSYQARIPSLGLSPGHPRPAASLLGPVAASVSGDRRSKPRGYSTSTLMNQYPSVLSLQSSQINGTGTPKPAFAPFLLRTLPKAPPNPRDHSLLEGIYNEMNAMRFINLSPLSLLANLVGLHFKDVRTHPPLQFTFPPPVAKAPLEELTTDDDTDSDDAKNAIIPSPRRRQSIQSGMSSSLSGTAPGTPRSPTFGGDEPSADEHRWVNMSGLLKRESRYISLDDARMSAFSPATRSSFPALSPVRGLSGLPAVEPPASGSLLKTGGDAAGGKPQINKNRLPNATLNIDVRSLNMHLALRTAEILACSESMWEWVVSYQTSFHAERAAGRPRAGSLASELSPRASRLTALPSNPEMDAFKTAVLDLSREDFDGLLVKFEMDMREHMAIGSTLRDQFSWTCMPIAPSQDRKVFQAACDRWEQWQDQQRRKPKSPYERHQTRNSIDTPYQTGSSSVDRHENAKPEIIRGRSSLPETTSRRRTASIPPDRQLSRSIRVFAAWKP